MKNFTTLFIFIISLIGCNNYFGLNNDEINDLFSWEIELIDTQKNLKSEKYFHDKILLIENRYLNDSIIETWMLDHFIQEAMSGRMSQHQFDTLNNYFIDKNYLTDSLSFLKIHFWRPFTYKKKYQYQIFVDSKILDTINFNSFPSVKFYLPYQNDKISKFELSIIKKENDKEEIVKDKKFMFYYSKDGILANPIDN